MDENTRIVLLAFVGAIITLGSAYIAARWSITNRNNRNGPSGTATP